MSSRELGEGHDLPHLHAALHSGRRRRGGAATAGDDRARARRRPLRGRRHARRPPTDLTGQGTILLVEDEEGLRALNARGLTSRGYTVIEAGNGVEAMEMLEQQGGKVDLVVSDVVMPEMDGPTLLKELQASANPRSRSSSCRAMPRTRSRRALPDHKQFNFLAKPFTLKQLVAKVKETMAG